MPLSRDTDTQEISGVIEARAREHMRFLDLDPLTSLIGRALGLIWKKDDAMTRTGAEGLPSTVAEAVTTALHPPALFRPMCRSAVQSGPAFSALLSPLHLMPPTVFSLPGDRRMARQWRPPRMPPTSPQPHPLLGSCRPLRG